MGKLNHTEILNEILRPSFSFLFYMVLIDVLTYLILWYCQWLIEVIFSVEAYGCEGNRYQNVVTCPTVGLRSSISCCCSVVKSCLTLQPHGLQHTRLFCPPPPPGVCSNSCPLNWWCCLTISSSAAPFFCLQSFPASGSFPMNWLFTSDSQSIEASTSVLPMNIQGWFPLGLIGLISSLSKGLSRVFSSTTVWKHQFIGAQSSLWFNSHIHTWLLEAKWISNHSPWRKNAIMESTQNLESKDLV